MSFGGSRRGDRRRYPKTEAGATQSHSRGNSPKAQAGSSVLSTLLQHKRARYSRSNSNSSSPSPHYDEQYQAGGRPHSSSFSSRHSSRNAYSHHPTHRHNVSEKYFHHHRQNSRTQRGDSVSSRGSSDEDGDNLGGFRGDERRVLSRDERRKRFRDRMYEDGDFGAMNGHSGRPRAHTFDAHSHGTYSGSQYPPRFHRTRRTGSREYYDSGDDDGYGRHGHGGPARSYRDRSASFAHGGSGNGGYGRRRASTVVATTGMSGDYKKRLRPRTSNNNR